MCKDNHFFSIKRFNLSQNNVEYVSNPRLGMVLDLRFAVVVHIEKIA